MACTNKSLPEYQELNEALGGNTLLTDIIIGQHRVKIKDSEAYPTVDEAVELLSKIEEVSVSDLTKERYKGYVESAATDVQRKVIQGLAKFEDRTEFDEKSHTYTDKDTGVELASTTQTIGGKVDFPKFNNETDAQYALRMKSYWLSRAAGNYVDIMLDQMLRGVSLENMNLSVLDQQNNPIDLEVSEDLKKAIYEDLLERVDELTADGSVLIPQFRVQNMSKKLGGSIDVLIVHPDGEVSIYDLKTSKNSVLKGQDLLKYESAAYPVGEGSVFYGPEGQAIKLTKRQKQSLQVNTYGRMLEHAGFTVNQTRTIHYKLDFNENLNGLTNFEYENLSESRWSDDADYADMILPLSTGTQYKNKYAQAILKAQKENQTEEKETAAPKRRIKDTSTDSLPTSDLIKKLAEGVIKPLRSRLATLEHLKEQRENIRDKNVNIFVPKGDQTINTLASLIDLIEADIAAGKPLLGFGRFLNYAIQNMEETNEFLSRDDIYEKESTAGVLLNYERFLNSYEAIAISINSLNNVLPGEQQNLLNKFARVHSISLDKYQIARKDFIKGVLNTTSQQLTEEEIEELYNTGQDISMAAAGAVDLDTSSDIFLRLIAKNFKEKMDYARIKTMQFIDRLDRASADLIKLSPGRIVDYSFMYEQYGENDYRIINPISDEYFQIRKKLYDDLKDAEGNMMQYREISDISKASKEDIEYNKALFKKKEELSRFNRAEIRGADGTLEDGEYHKYSEEFKNARARFEYWDGLRWKRRAGVSDSAYYNYRSKYFTKVDYVGAVKSSKSNTFSGIAVKKSGYFVKGKYKDIRTTTSKGKDMRSDKYKKLMEDSTPMGVARRKFYAFYKEEYDSGFLQRLPTDVYNSLKYKFPTEDAMANKIEEMPTGVLRTFGRMGRAFFNFAFDWRLKTPEVRNVKVTEDGEVISEIPVMYGVDYAGAANVDEIQKLESLREELTEKYKKGKLTQTQYYKEKDKIRVKLTRLKARPKNVKPVRDLAASMKTMAASIEMYEKKIVLEDVFALMRNQVNNRQYFKGEQLVAGTSNVSKRLEQWSKQIFRAEDYTVNFNRTQRVGTVIARKLKSALSLKSVGLNPISWTSNAAWGVLTDAIEATGGRYFNIRAYKDAVGLYSLEYLPGLMRKMPKMNSRFEIPDTLPNSKYEAVVRRFDMVRNLLDQGDRGGSSGIPLEYKGIDVVEYAVQSQTGIAILKTLKVYKFDDDGNQIDQKSLYDAMLWDQKNSSVSLAEGYKLKKDYGGYTGEFVEINDKEISDIRNYIFEVNKQLHGNYAEEDKVAWQHSVMGDLAFQFHKWVIPAIKAGYRSRYFDENLGWYEGRMISFFNFAAATFEHNMNFLKAWKETDDLGRANLRKVTAQLGVWVGAYLMGRLLLEAFDDDDEDDTQATQALNAVLVLLDIVEGDAAYLVNPGEIITSAKNPIPVLKYAKGIQEAVWKSIQYFYYAIAQSDEELLNNKNVYYQRGYRKGKMKLAKEWRDILPALSVINRWEGFRTVRTNYYE